MTHDKAAATAVMTDMVIDVEEEAMAAVITVPDETMMIVTVDTDVIATTTDLVSIATAVEEDVMTAMVVIDEVVATAVEDVMTDPTTEVETAAMVPHLLNMETQLLVEKPLINLMVAASQMRELILVAIKC